MPQLSRKLGTSVRRYRVWNAKPRNPIVKEDAAVLSAMGTASGQRVKRSTIVKRYAWPSDLGRGRPTISTWMC